MIPMLARTLGPKFNQFPCFVQPKLNGVRALYQQAVGGIFQSRDEKVWKENVLVHLEKELLSLESLDGLILDGELYVHGWRLQRINGAVATNRKEPSEDTKNVEFHVFDVVDPNRSFSQRWFDLYHPLQMADLPHIKAVPTFQCLSRDELELHFHHYTRLGYEGIMLRPDGPYEFGEHMGRGGTMTQYRSKTLWKHKQWEDDEFRCVGVTQGEGKADIGVGALILTTYTVNSKEEVIDIERLQHTLDSTFKVGTGFTDEERIEFMKNPPIGKLVKVRYLCLTADGIPFNPSFLCVMS